MIIPVNKARELVKNSKLEQLEKDVNSIIESAAKEGCSECTVTVVNYPTTKLLLKRLLDIGYIAYAMSDYEIYISWAEE